MKPLKSLPGLLSSAFLILCLAACSDGSGDGAAVVSFADEPGEFAAGRRTDVMLRDVERARDITATFWYPTAGPNQGSLQAEEGASLIPGDRKFPLVVLIHGITDNAPGAWNYLGPHLASHGYIVLAPSTGSNASTRADIVNHPGDVSFLIDTALGENAADPIFVGRVQAQKILVGGFSFGGLATYLFAYEPQHQDPRTTAILLIAPARSGAVPVNPDLTLLVLQGTDDPLISFNSSLNVFQAANAPKYMVTLQGAGHIGFTGSAASMGAGTMSDLRVKSITRVTVLAYLRSLFADSAAEQDAATQFLRESLDAQNGDVTVMFE